jgi:hypothetical protein
LQLPPRILAFYPLASPLHPSEIANEFLEGLSEKPNIVVPHFLSPLRMNPRPRCSILLWLAAFAIVPPDASAEGPTNEAAFSIPSFSAAVNYYSKPSEVFVDRFFQEVGNSESLIFDRLTGPSSRLGQARAQDRLGYASIERFNADGLGLISRIASDSLRTAAFATLPLDEWQDHSQSWITSLVLGSLGTPEEEHVRLTAIAYSDVRAAWETTDRKAGIQFGIRPWRTSPYAYILAHAGHWNGGPLITFEGRARYTMFGSARLEGRLSMPLPSGFRLGGGISVDPLRLRAGEPDPTGFGVTLERVIRFNGRSPDALFYVGFRSGLIQDGYTMRHENVIVAGLSKTW